MSFPFGMSDIHRRYITIGIKVAKVDEMFRNINIIEQRTKTHEIYWALGGGDTMTAKFHHLLQNLTTENYSILEQAYTKIRMQKISIGLVKRLNRSQIKLMMKSSLKKSLTSRALNHCKSVCIIYKTNQLIMYYFCYIT